MKRFYKDIKKYAYYMFYGAKTDLKSEVANSYLNWLWWILEPFCEMLVFTLVFGILFASSEEYFPVYVYSGLITWKFFSQSLTYSVSLVRKNKGIITKVYAPKYVFLLENMMLNLFKLLISCSVLAILMLWYKIELSFMVLYLIPIYLVLFVFTFGFGLILLHFGVFVDDLAHAITILLRLLFYVSGVFYNMESRFPVESAHTIKIFNPIAMIMDSMHNVLLYKAQPDTVLLVIWGALSIIIVFIGIHIVYKYENTYVKVV